MYLFGKIGCDAYWKGFLAGVFLKKSSIRFLTKLKDEEHLQSDKRIKKEEEQQ